MKVFMILVVIKYLTKIQSGNCSNYEPVCIVKIDYDPVLKIESIENALKLNVPHTSWLVCPPDSEDELKLTVSRKAMFVANDLLNEENKDFKCTKKVTPVLLESKIHTNHFDIGFEVSTPKNINYVIDKKQLNLNYKRKKTLVKKALSIMNLTKKKREKQQLSFISVLSVKLRPKRYVKTISYEIVHAKYVRSEIEEIKCTFDMKKYEHFVNEDDFATKLTFKRTDKRIIDISGEPSDTFDLIFLAPKQHLISKGKQQTACALQNISVIRNLATKDWIKTNEFIMETARKLGRLEITAATAGLLEIQVESSDVYKQVIVKLSGHEINVPQVVWRLVKYTIYSDRNDAEIEFGIIIITHNYPAQSSDYKVCKPICKESGWDPIWTDFTYCCPVDEMTLMTLGVDKKILPMKNVLKISIIKNIEHKYEKFDANYFKPFEF